MRDLVVLLKCQQGSLPGRTKRCCGSSNRCALGSLYHGGIYNLYITNATHQHLSRDQTPWEGRQFGLTNPSPSRRLRQPRGQAAG